MKFTSTALAAGLLAMASAQTSEICELIITKTAYLTSTTTLSEVPESYTNVPTVTSTFEVTSSVVVTVTVSILIFLKARPSIR